MTLTLPDTETMRDPGWQLLAHQLNGNSISYLSLISETLVRFVQR